MSSPSFQTLTPIPAGGPADIPAHTDPRPTVTYSGPSMSWLITHRKLAHQIIACHSLPPSSRILDSANLAFLRAYVNEGENVLRERDMLPKERAAQKGSLVGYAIQAGAFDEESLGLLREWFASGVLDGELDGVEPNE